MRYFDLYLAALYDELQRGGTQEVVDKTIAEVNNPTQAGLTAYLTARGRGGFMGMVGPCGVCGEPFPLEQHEPTLDEEVLCQNCKKQTNPA